MKSSRNKFENGKKVRMIRNICLVAVLFVFALILSSLNAAALGVAPAEKTVIFEGKDISYDIRIVNDEKKEETYSLEVNGELSKYVSLSRNSLSFTSSKSEDTISLKLSIPQNENIAPGEYTIRLVIKGQKKNSTGVVAYVGVISKLIITIPGDNAFVKVSTFVPNFINGEQNSFSAEITNVGSKSATNCFAVIEIYSSANAKIDSLTSSKVNVLSARTERLLLQWKPTTGNGLYTAKTSVFCDGISSEEVKPFSIGSPKIIVVDLVADNFELGEINKFNMILGSEWGEKIEPVYADVEITKDGNVVAQAKTESTSILPLKRVSLPVYLDTAAMAPGEYSMYIMLHYMNKNLGEAYDVRVSTDRIIIEGLSGMVVGGASGIGASAAETGSGGVNTLLIVAIVILLIFIIILLLKLLKKKGK